MKTAAKVFIILGMIFGAIAIIPLIVGIFALKALEEKTRSEMTGIAIVTLLLCSLLGGIFMLCLTDEELKPAKKEQPKEN